MLLHQHINICDQLKAYDLSGNLLLTKVIGHSAFSSDSFLLETYTVSLSGEAFP